MVPFLQVLESGMSKGLLKYFESPEVLEHDGGHFVPATSAIRQQYVDFLIKFDSQ